MALKLCVSLGELRRKCETYMVNVAKKHVGREYDVTRIVQRVDPNVASAKIVITEVLRIERYGARKPPARNPEEIVRGWLRGIEKQRYQCPYTKEWYWITYRVRFTYTCKPGYVRT